MTRDRAEWLAEHGVKPEHVPADSTFVEETNEDGVRVVTFDALALDEFGRADVDRQNLRFRTERRTGRGDPVRGVASGPRRRRARRSALAALDPDAAGELKGPLDEALEAAGLPKSGSADDKRARCSRCSRRRRAQPRVARRTPSRPRSSTGPSSPPATRKRPETAPRTRRRPNTRGTPPASRWGPPCAPGAGFYPDSIR